jgi:hypothetical protein
MACYVWLKLQILEFELPPRYYIMKVRLTEPYGLLAISNIRNNSAIKVGAEHYENTVIEN